MMKYLIIAAALLVLSACDNSFYVKCNANQVQIGMSEADLIAVCGITKRNYASNGSTQWVYRGSENLYVYTENGFVRSKQWSD